MFKWVILTFFSVLISAHGTEVESIQSGFFESLLNETLDELPGNYLDRVGIKISVTKGVLPLERELPNDLCKIDESLKLTKFNGNTIIVSNRLVHLAENNRETFNCGHKNFYNKLKAVIIHELTHLKDDAEQISLNPDFQRIVGMKKVQSNSQSSPLNRNVSTSPDAYEFTNLQESLAINTEFFVLDPEFECRRPATANFLSKQLGIRLKGICEKNYKVIAQSSFVEDNYQWASSIDPKRIYQIQYLFAGKGQTLMSRWGHAMFRLVVCAPWRTQIGPECLGDVSHHLVLSYRAFMNDIDIKYSRGLSGGYPSQLFVFRFHEIQQEYNKYELRDLFSVPLKMTSVQKKDFLDLTLERYWTYQGKYYFIDNNCGTEAVKHLSVALSDEESKLISSITPLKIYRDIIKGRNNLTEDHIENFSRSEMISKNLLSVSIHDSLGENYQFLRPIFPSFSSSSFDKFMMKSKAATRLKDYENFAANSFNLTSDHKMQIALKLAYLERYISGRFTANLLKKVVGLMDKDQDLKNQIIKYGHSLKLVQLQPWEVIGTHYGAPTSSEFENQFPQFLIERKEMLRTSIENQLQELQAILDKKYFDKELIEIEDMKKIKEFTKSFIN